MKRANVAIFVPHLGCPHDCSFCNQRRISGHDAPPTPQNVKATAQEAIAGLGKKAAHSEIAFFGGSFTAIEPELMTELLRAAAPYVGGGGFKGIRISTRPDAIDTDKLATLKKFGVTAIELGAQSMDDHVLSLNQRGHTAQQVKSASAQILHAGFELGLQMMTGLYGDTDKGARSTAREIIALRPATVRIYPTIVLRGTALEALFLSGRYQPQGLESAVSLCAELIALFEQSGIRVIRVGLHASEGIESGYVAGPWHPAFRELCESRLFLENARAALAGMHVRQAALLVGQGNVSKLAGQHRSNLDSLEKEFDMSLKIKTSEELQGREVRAVRLA